MANIVYTFEGHVYLNITNACPCKCEFCIRNNGDSVGDADTLWFSGHSPSFEQVKKRKLTSSISRVIQGRLSSAATASLPALTMYWLKPQNI